MAPTADPLSPDLRRFHTLIFSLLYPAFLGTFIVSILSEPLIEIPPWGPLLAVYLSAQFVEGHGAGRQFKAARGAIHLVEIALMAFAFTAMGYFGSTLKDLLPSYDVVPFLLALIFFAPITQWMFFTVPRENRGFYRWLMAMSLAAAVLSLLLRDSWWGWGLVAVLLAVYIVVFQFLNHKIFGPSSIYRRPAP